jgi:DNA-binding transcriptional ArsR family regulator
VTPARDVQESSQVRDAPETSETDDSTEFEGQRQKSVDIGLFARFPNKFFGSGTARKLGTSASLLYFALCENANRNREPSNTFKASDKALASETGLSPRTLRNVRIRLLENGLVTYQREPGESYTYTLVRQNLSWVKLTERLRPKRRARGMSTASAAPEP